MTDITAPRFNDVDAAREHLEGIRWPDGPYCPHCGSLKAKRLPDQKGKPSKAYPAGKIRKGLYQCNDCRQQYSVTVGTVFSDSKIPLHKWLLANHLMCSSKKGISAHQLHRMLGITYKSAWFMAHRIREAMIDTDDTPFGSGGGFVEVDETFIGRDPDAPVARKKDGAAQKMKVLSLVDRETKRSRSVVVDNLTVKDLMPIIQAHVSPDAVLMTDQARHYQPIGREFATHHRINHGDGDYVDRVNPLIHTNTVESWFGVFKRGMRGVYQHCGKQHLGRYLVEFDFRYANRSGCGVDDDTRADIALHGITGKRLTYRRIGLGA